MRNRVLGGEMRNARTEELVQRDVDDRVEREDRHGGGNRGQTVVDLEAALEVADLIDLVEPVRS